MAMFLKISPEPEFLYVTVTGEFSLAEGKRTFPEILDAVAKYGLDRVLFDGRAVTGEPAALDRFYYGIFVADAVAKFKATRPMPDLRFAYVLVEPVLDPNRVGENTAVNRGMWVKTFDNLEEALEWLGVELSSRPDSACT